MGTAFKRCEFANLAFFSNSHNTNQNDIDLLTLAADNYNFPTWAPWEHVVSFPWCETFHCLYVSKNCITAGPVFSLSCTFFSRAFYSLLCVLFHAWKECSRKITGFHSFLEYRKAANGGLEMCHVNLLVEKTSLWKKFNLIASCCIPFKSQWKAGFKLFVEIFCYWNSHLQATCNRDLSITKSELEDMQVQSIWYSFN